MSKLSSFHNNAQAPAFYLTYKVSIRDIMEDLLLHANEGRFHSTINILY